MSVFSVTTNVLLSPRVLMVTLEPIGTPAARLPVDVGRDSEASMPRPFPGKCCLIDDFSPVLTGQPACKWANGKLLAHAKK